MRARLPRFTRSGVGFTGRPFDKLRANGVIYGVTAQADHSRYPCLP